MWKFVKNAFLLEINMKLALSHDTSCHEIKTTIRSPKNSSISTDSRGDFWETCSFSSNDDALKL